MHLLNRNFLDFRGDVAARVHIPPEAYRKRPNRPRKTQTTAIPEAKLANARPYIGWQNIASNALLIAPAQQGRSCAIKSAHDLLHEGACS
jgi:hypothetical protein